MRHLGNLPQREQAERFVAHLLTQGIPAKLDSAGDQWAVWVQEEDSVAAAKAQLAAFQLEPNHPRYEGVEQKAQRLFEEERRRRETAARNIVEMRGRWKSGAVGAGRPAPWTVGLILISIAVSFLTNFSNPQDAFGKRMFELLAFVDFRAYVVSQDPLANIKQGQVWRAVTPMLLHGSMLHLAFNMMWLYQLGRLVEWKFGRWRLLWLVLLFSAISSVSNAVSPMKPEWLRNFLGSGPFIVGMSGVVYGLFGFIWMQSKYNPSFGVRLEPFTVVLMVGWLVYCFLPFSSIPVANVAHLTGLLSGVVVGRLPLFNP